MPVDAYLVHPARSVLALLMDGTIVVRIAQQEHTDRQLNFQSVLTVQQDDIHSRMEQHRARHVPREWNPTKALEVRNVIRFLRVNSEAEHLARPTHTLRVAQPSARTVPRESTPTPVHPNASSVTSCIVFPHTAILQLLESC